MTRIVLASTSRYRRDLLARLLPDFAVDAPDVDEVSIGGELPRDLAIRLAFAKAQTVAQRHPDALVIGSDQVAELDGRALGKPGSMTAACDQLAASSGKTVSFHTALCLFDTRDGEAVVRAAVDHTQVVFRTLDTAMIARYVNAERPLDCAGSFKAEGLGIALFERIESLDPTALIGLPLIALARLLREAGIVLP